jgi:hypothetical protein
MDTFILNMFKDSPNNAYITDEIASKLLKNALVEPSHKLYNTVRNIYNNVSHNIVKQAEEMAYYRGGGNINIKDIDTLYKIAPPNTLIIPSHIYEPILNNISGGKLDEDVLQHMEYIIENDVNHSLKILKKISKK